MGRRGRPPAGGYHPDPDPETPPRNIPDPWYPVDWVPEVKGYYWYLRSGADDAVLYRILLDKAGNPWTLPDLLPILPGQGRFSGPISPPPRKVDRRKTEGGLEDF